ncbi:MAG TPA: hypothetical protein VMH81_12965 [Bryobacteraceae bacterium]|nr:hypothetical protein [Bryobacteraceae bacterium]
MSWRLSIWVLSAASLAAQGPHSVNDTIDLVRTALRGKQTDRQTARSLRKWKLSESLDARAVEELESDGAGPATVAELERLRLASAALPKPATAPAFDSPPVPAPQEQSRIVEEARAIALTYTDSLPNFIAIESVRRYTGDHGSWRLKDTLHIKLSYFEKAEDYAVMTVNGRPSNLAYEAIGGTISEGEFGSMLREVFEPRSRAELHWDHWTRLRGRPAHVYSFRVRPEHSRYTMAYGNSSGRHTITAGQHGFVYVDAETRQIVRIASEADSIPEDFLVRSSATSLDYGFADVGGQRYLLPLRAEVHMTTPSLDTRNEVEFQSYQKFAADSSIRYEGPVPPKK